MICIRHNKYQNIFTKIINNYDLNKSDINTSLIKMCKTGLGITTI